MYCMCCVRVCVTCLPYTLAERNVMTHSRSPFLAYCHFCIETEYDCNVVMPYLSGGDLRHWVRAHGQMDEEMFCYYAAEIVVGLQTLHAMLIVWRGACIKIGYYIMV